MLDRQQLVAFIDDHYNQPGDRLYRLEQLPVYADNASTLARWRVGVTEPDWDSPWSRTLATEKERGLISQRVRVLSEQLTEDERAACLLGYPPNARYEDIRILHRGEHEIETDLQFTDYWLMETADGDVRVLVMAYDDAGRFLGAQQPPRVDWYLDARDRALAAAEPWDSWWPRHRDLGQRAA